MAPIMKLNGKLPLHWSVQQSTMDITYPLCVYPLIAQRQRLTLDFLGVFILRSFFGGNFFMGVLIFEGVFIFGDFHF